MILIFLIFLCKHLFYFIIQGKIINPILENILFQQYYKLNKYGKILDPKHIIQTMERVAQICAPAKAILCGQHAVVYGQDAIAFAVNLKCTAQIYFNSQPKQESQNIISLYIHIQSSTQRFSFQYKYAQILSSFLKEKQFSQLQIQGFTLKDFQNIQFYEDFCDSINKQRKQVWMTKTQSTILYKIALFCYIFSINKQRYLKILNNQNFIIQTLSNIPIGKGLGSSASFNSALAASLLIILQVLTKQQIQSNKTYKNLINHISRTFQKIQHGKPSGIDNFVSINGGIVLFNRSKNPPFKLITNWTILKNLSQKFCIGFVDSQIQKNTKLAVSNVLKKYNEYLTGQMKCFLQTRA